MPVTFEQPWWLLTALLAAPMGWLGWRWLSAMSAPRRASAVLLRAVLTALIAAMLAGASAVRSSDRVAVVAVIDVSDSVRLFAERFGDMPKDAKGRAKAWEPSVRDWLAKAREGRGPDDLLGAVVFDGSSIALAVPSASGDFEYSFDARGAQGTDIAGALRFARALFPAGANRRLVLVSDGNQTGGDALAAAGELAADRIPVDVVPLSYRVRREVIVESVDAPPIAAEGSTVRLRVVLSATEPTPGALEVLHDGRPLDLNGSESGTSRRVTLPAGRSVEIIDVPLPVGAVHRFQPVFIPDDPATDQLATNNRAETFTVTPSKGRALVVDGVSDGEASGAGSTLVRTLKEAKIDASSVSPRDAPQDLLSLNAYDLVVLQNVPAEAMSRSAQNAMAEYVTKLGGGLVMVGGVDSFGPGGWKGTPVEPILPVSLDLPEQIVAPPAGVALVIDNSGSMARPMPGSVRNKQQLANEGAALAVLALDRSDALTVVAFNSSADVVIPIGRNRDPRKNASLVRGIGSGGGTNIASGLVLAAEQLNTLDRTPVRHMILLTDGRDDGSSGLPDQAKSLKARGITVSTIGVGDDVDADLLAAIANAGGGKFYNVTDPNVLPRIFVKEVRVVRKPLIRETPFVPRVVRGATLADGLGATPALEGLVLTQPRKDPRVTTAMVTPENEPVLAYWRSGRGQVAAFTSDAHNVWARRWLGWPGYAQLWTRLARAIARPANETSSELTVQVTGDTLKVRLDAADEGGVPLDMLAVPGTVYLPDETSIDVRLAQTGPGVYEMSMPVRETGTYIVALAPTQGAKVLAPIIGGASAASGPETRRLRSDDALMERIARVTSGRVLDLKKPEEARLFDREGLRPTVASLPLWRTLLVWTLIVLVLDIGTRRLAWDRLLSREWRLAMKQQSASAIRDRADRAARTVASLKRPPSGGEAPPSTVPQPPRVAREPEAGGNEAARREEAQRQQDARRAATRTDALRERAGGATSAGKSPTTSEPEAPAESTSELLKAKRRARQRFDEQG